MIEAVGLSKFYGDFAAARDIAFSVPRGQVCAFLGPNGAGKSSLVKLIDRSLHPIFKPTAHLKLFGSSTVNLWQ